MPPEQWSHFFLLYAVERDAQLTPLFDLPLFDHPPKSIVCSFLEKGFLHYWQEHVDRVRRGEASDHLEAATPRDVTWATMKFVIIPLTCPRPVSGMSCVVIGSCWITDSQRKHAEEPEPRAIAATEGGYMFSALFCI